MKHTHDTRPAGIRIIWCQVIVACALTGTFFGSLGIGFSLFCLCALLLHYCFERIYSNALITFIITTIWLIPIILWGWSIDKLISTSYVSVILILATIASSAIINTQLLKWPPIDSWFKRD